MSYCVRQIFLSPDDGDNVEILNMIIALYWVVNHMVFCSKVISAISCRCVIQAG
uniref:Uncharacterized protein n=1 Tax=Arundo donax TaxID=35708 RepID=A0A0A9GCL0_ARUDO